MSAADCISEINRAAGGKLSLDEITRIAETIDRRRARLVAEGKVDAIDQKMREAAAEAGAEARLAAALQRKHAALNAIIRDQLETRVAQHIATGRLTHRQALRALLEGTMKGVEGGRDSAMAGRLGYEQKFLGGGILAPLQRDAPEAFHMMQDRAFQLAVRREMMELRPDGRPGITGDRNAQITARIFAAGAEMSRVELNRLGANIGKLEGWAGPQYHDPHLIMAAGRQAWLDFIVPRIDPEKTFGGVATPEEARAILDDVYNTIVTGRDRSLSAAEKGEFSAPANLAKSLAQHREIHFNSAEHAQGYDERFGRGSIFVAIAKHQERAARAAGAMQKFGPNPRVMIDGLAESLARRVRDDPKMTDRQKVAEIQGLSTDSTQLGHAVDEMLGTTLAPVSTSMASIGSGVRSINSMGKLGAALISSFGDLVTAATNLRYQGMPIGVAYARQIAETLKGRGRGETRQLTYLLNEGVDGVIGHLIARAEAQDSAPGMISQAMEGFFRLSGLTLWTDSMRAGNARAMAAEMARMARREWKNLPARYRHTLQQHSIGPEDWDAIRQIGGQRLAGGVYLTPEQVDNLPNEAIDALIADEIASLKARPPRPYDIIPAYAQRRAEAAMAAATAPQPVAARPAAEGAGAPPPAGGAPGAGPAAAPAATPSAAGAAPAAPVPSPVANGVSVFRPNELTVDASRFQFKEGGDEGGVTDRLRGVTQWDPIKAGMVLVWENAAGQRFIVDGHQRLGLAKRIAAADPNQQPLLNGYLLKESDGITDQEARVVAAAKNIAEGTGTAIDAAKVLRDAPDLAKTLPPRSELVRQANALATLDLDAFRMVVNGLVPPHYGAIVGRLVPHDGKLQAALIDLLHKTQPENATQAEAIARQGMESGTVTETQATLFGDQEQVATLYLDRAKILDRALRQLKRDRTVFNLINRERSTIEEAGNQLNVDANTVRAENDARSVQILQILATRKGPISDALTAAARDARAGKTNYAAAGRAFVDVIRREAETSDLARLTDGGERGAAAPGEQAAAGERPAPGAAGEQPAAAGAAIEGPAPDVNDLAQRDTGQELGDLFAAPSAAPAAAAEAPAVSAAAPVEQPPTPAPSVPATGAPAAAAPPPIPEPPAQALPADQLERLRARGRLELELKLRRFIADETTTAVIEPDAATRRIMFQGTRPGTLAGEAMRAIWQFKGYPVAFTQRTLARAVVGGIGETAAQRLLNSTPHLAQLAAGLAVLGYISMTAKDAIRGYTPRDPRKQATIAAAIAQGGGLGIFGDFLFGQTSRFGGSVLETAAGPTAGNIAGLVNLWTKAREGNSKAADYLNLALSNTPYLNLFYVRPALDFLFLNEIREALSPGFLRRQQRQREQDYGQKSFIPRTIGGNP